MGNDGSNNSNGGGSGNGNSGSTGNALGSSTVYSRKERGGGGNYRQPSPPMIETRNDFCGEEPPSQRYLPSLSSFKRNRIIGRRVLRKQNGHDREIIQNGYNFAVYALAMYTQLITLYMFPVTGSCRICGCFNCTTCVHTASSVLSAAASPSPSSSSSASSSTPAGTSPSASSPASDAAAGSGALDIESNRDVSASAGGSKASYHPQSVMVDTLKRGKYRWGKIVGDNRCGAHQSAVREILRIYNKLETTDIHYLSLINTTYAKPYAVFIDHESGSIVIAIRGTLSLEDCITDAMAQPVEMIEVGKKWGFDGKGKWGHGGMLRAADHIRTEEAV